MADSLRINGLQHSWSSTKCKINGEQYAGLTKISWDDTIEEGQSRGQGAKPRGRTRGRYVPGQVSITLAKSSAMALKTELAKKSRTGKAFGTVVFPITLQYLEPDDTPITVEFRDCRILTTSTANEEGSDASMEEMTISAMEILENGLSLMEDVG